LPFATTIEEFTITSEGTEAINQEGKATSAVSWCCLLGLISNVLHICFYEWFTSHGCPSVRNLVRSINLKY
jgi:hypothetical protein